MKKDLRLEIATEMDAEEIRDLMVKVEEDETSKFYETGNRPFIPGYDSIEMQKYHMWDRKYYKILIKSVLRGVILISSTGRNHARIDRLYIDPEIQGEGVGARVISIIEKMYPNVKIWTLDTSQQSKRNHYFYEKNGYKLIDEDDEERYYQKLISDKTSELDDDEFEGDFTNKNFKDCYFQHTDFYNSDFNNASFSNLNLSHTTYLNSNLTNSRFTNSNMSKTVFGDSNMNDMEICHVSLAGAYLHDTNLGFGDAKRPLMIERCELTNSTMKNSNLQNLSIENCHIAGMRINGILVTELLNTYNDNNKK